jgi:hypothetical protein
VVRGLAALLGLAAAQAYVLLAGELPRLDPPDTALLVAGAAGLLVIVVDCAVTAPVSDERPLLWLILLGGAVVVATINAADAGAAATPAEAVTWAALGGAFALAMLTPPLAIALPLFVAGVDVVSAVLGGPGEVLAEAGQSQAGDPLTLELPAWGDGIAAGHVGAADAVFAGAFLVYARRFGLRPVATAVGLAIALIGALVLKLEADVEIPPVPLMSAAYFLVNADRLGALFRRTGEG